MNVYPKLFVIYTSGRVCYLPSEFHSYHRLRLASTSCQSISCWGVLWPVLHGTWRISSAIQEIVVQLERVQSLRFVTAKKGATAAYTLDEFFDEQAR